MVYDAIFIGSWSGLYVQPERLRQVFGAGALPRQRLSAHISAALTSFGGS